MNLTRQTIEDWLREKDPQKLQQLWTQADNVRKKTVGDDVHLRGLVEISNHCIRTCRYCGLNAENHKIERYRMTAGEILDCTRQIVRFGYGTIVMQAGEDYGIRTAWLADLIGKIKQTTPLAVTLSMGERPFEDLQHWRRAGADRYLLRFETSDAALYNEIHPPRPGQTIGRFEILTQLRQLDYEVGSGVMIGIPGQSYASLAADIEFFGKLDMDMVGVGPYIANPNTPLGSRHVAPAINPADQVPNTDLMTCKVIALTRLACPQANIPSTTALATINRDNGRELGLSRGANVVMPNFTPPQYRTKYEIYPGKACLNETAEVCSNCLAGRIASIGRTVGTGPGGRKRDALTSSPSGRE